MTYDIALALRTWGRVPVEGCGNLDSAELLSLPATDLKRLVERAATHRYERLAPEYAAALALDEPGHGRAVLDLGCGLGLDSLRLARAGWQVVLADIVLENTRLARRVLQLYGYDALRTNVALAAPFITERECWRIDRLHSSGVLHHTPHAAELLREARGMMRAGGEARLMLYSDRAWTHWTGENDPDPGADPTTHLRWYEYVLGMDGNTPVYADWYSREKVRRLAEAAGWQLEDFRYLLKSEAFCAVRLGLL